MSFQIDHNLLHNIDNKITLDQWNELMSLVKTSAATTRQIKGAIYSGTDQLEGKQRHFCYDNLDRYDVPGFDLTIQTDSDVGTLTVYNGSEQARAPITFDQGLFIATNFFEYEGYDMSERIVCDWVMDGNPSIF